MDQDNTVDRSAICLEKNSLRVKVMNSIQDNDIFPLVVNLLIQGKSRREIIEECKSLGVKTEVTLKALDRAVSIKKKYIRIKAMRTMLGGALSILVGIFLQFAHYRFGISSLYLNISLFFTLCGGIALLHAFWKLFKPT